MAGQRPASKSLRAFLPLLIGIALLLVSTYLVFYREYVDPLPTDADVWEPVMEAYPNEGMDCHVSIVDRALHVSALLRDSPYVDNDLLRYEAERRANNMAVEMVISEGTGSHPACVGRTP